MIRFEVTGETPEQFARNAIEAWGVLATGLQQMLAVQTTAAAPISPAGLASVASAPIEENPKLSGSIAASPKTTTTFKPDQIKDRLAEVVLAHGTVAGRDLLSKVNAKKVTDIDTDEKRAEFMRASEEYLTPRNNSDMNDDIPF